jgi:hypothetical protein
VVFDVEVHRNVVIDTSMSLDGTFTAELAKDGQSI